MPRDETQEGGEQVHPEVTDELRAAWAQEAETRADPNVQMTVAELLRSGNPKLRKLGALYQQGIITHPELEMKVREVLSPKS
jgi:hypothetical protein